MTPKERKIALDAKVAAEEALKKKGLSREQKRSLRRVVKSVNDVTAEKTAKKP